MLYNTKKNNKTESIMNALRNLFVLNMDWEQLKNVNIYCILQWN